MTQPGRTVRNALALLALAAPAGAVAAESGIEARFRNWIVGCDNVRTCRAIGFPADPDGSGAALVLERSGEGAARPVLRLSLDRPDDDAAPLAGAFDLAADGRTLGRLEVDRNFRIVPNDFGRRVGDIRDPAIEAALLKALRSGRTVTAQWPGGDLLATISLDGAAAALLFVDDRQRRIGTQGALMRAGDRPDGAVPAPPALPDPPAPPARTGAAAPRAVPAEVRRLYNADVAKDLCDSDLARSAKPDIHRLDARTVLFGFPCLQGAYQGSTAYYVTSDTASPRAQRIRLPRPPVRPGPDQPREPAPPAHIVTGDDFSADLGEITEFAKGRGLGDCGTTGTWRWTGSGFALTSYSSMPVCGGLDPDDWLTLFRSREPAQRP